MAEAVEVLADTAATRTFSIEARGNEIVLRFRPRFYQQHRGLHEFAPWTYRTWDRPVVGWCSWFAYFANFTQKDLEEVVGILAKKHLADGQFPAGSMGPKIRAAVEYIEAGGREVLITKDSHLKAALLNRSGTRIVASA